MGIQGLLPLLKSIQKPCNLKQFAGQTIGVDAYGWLHRGTIACAVELALDKPTTKYVDFAMSRVRMLKHFGITPYIIFDGDYLPSKSKTEKERSTRRKESKKLGMQLLSLGKTSQAYLELQKAVDVTPEMAGMWIEELKRANVQYVVAPYEADSQMVYLEKQGIIQGILSEDSDLLVFGAKKLLTKLDQYGECVMIRRDDFTSCREVSFVGWTDREFRQMAIMSGCDYLNSIEKMGLKTAHRLLRKHKTMDRVIRAVQFDGKFKVPAGYAEAFDQAELTFLHQWVFCPETKKLVHLTPLEDGVTCEELPFIGKFVEARLAAGVSRGELHPHTKEPLLLPEVPRRGMWPPQRKQGPVETPDLKKHKPIESFFKAKRVPLAELDPNLFAASPSQDQLTRRASGSSWPATPVADTPHTMMARPSVLTPASAPVISRRAFSDQTPLRNTNSDRAPKRQRLCTEDSSPVSQKDTAKVEYGRSKFFGPTSATPSKRIKSGGKKDTDFSLWSDDSVEAALTDLPLDGSIQTSGKRRKKVPVFQDQATLDRPGAVSFADDAQETQVTTVFTQDETFEATPPSSSEEQVDRIPDTSPFDASLKAEIQVLREKFSFGGRTPSASTKIELKRTRSTPLAITYKSASSLKSTRTRDGLGGTMGAASSFPQSKVLFRDEPDLPDEALHQADEEIVIPGSDIVEPPSPAARSPAGEGHARPAMLGSEDLLISESDIDDGSEAGTPKARRVLDLGRFAFRA